MKTKNKKTKNKIVIKQTISLQFSFFVFLKRENKGEMRDEEGYQTRVWGRNKSTK